MSSSPPPEAALSVVRGPPLETEPGLGPLTLPGYLAELAQRHSTREALVMHGADGSVTRWSYAELFEKASQVARALIATGLPKGAFVAVLVTNRPEWLASVFGIAMAGGVAAPLSTFSTPSELQYLIKASCASTLILEPQILKKNFAAILHELEPAIGKAARGQLMCRQFPFLRRVVMLDVDETESGTSAVESWGELLASGSAVDQAAVEARAASVTPADPALLYFSSGSTGKPKGILNSHRGVAIQSWRWARLLAVKDADHLRGWGANGFFWSGAFAQTVGATLSCGGSIVLQPTFNAARALELIERERVSYITLWPHQMSQLTESPNWEAADLGSLRFIDRETIIARHPTVHTDWREPYASYGSTETFTLNTGYPSGTPLDVSINSHGVPLPGNFLKIADPLTGVTLRRGSSGEIAVKGATLMLGYVGVPLSETLDDEGYFPTGDGGYVDEQGRLFWEGRLNDIIKTGGANVSPLEIDGELMAIEGVKLSQTVGVPHETLGEMIIACVVTAEGHAFSEAELRDRLRQQLASYKVPRRFLFVAPEELSFTGSEKVRTAALREFAARRLTETTADSAVLV